MKSDGINFVAVGSAHLVGDKGIPALLKEKGFVVEQMVAAETAKPMPAIAASARKLQKLHYPDGRFSVSLPGNPQMKYTDLGGMRCVDYTYPEFSGLYQVSYVTMPQAPNPALTDRMYDSVVTSLMQRGKGTLVGQSNFNCGGYPGRQIEIKTTVVQGAVKKEILMRLRLFTAGKRLYIIGGTGTKAWLNSQAVVDFMNSISVSPETTSYGQAGLPQSAQSQQSGQTRADADARHREFQQHFNETQSRIRKDMEQSRARMQFHRFQ